MPKPKLTIFLENKIGGLQTYYTTLVQAGAFDQFDIRYLALDPVSDTDTRPKGPMAGAHTQVFSYRRSENIYHMFRRLARQLPREPGIIIVNQQTEITCLDVHRQPNQTVVYFCHDEAYVERALKFAHLIDAFVAHNPYFAERLKRELPAGRAKDVRFLPFGIHQDKALQRQANPDRPLKIIFIGRLHSTKGILDLPLIDDHLRAAGVRVEWSILGSGPEKGRFEQAVAGRDNFSTNSPTDSEDMLRKASTGDVFVFPTRLDGTPLALMEAMTVGLVPVVSEFNPGAHWMVPASAGFVCPLDPKEMAHTLIRLHTNRAELEARSQTAFAHAAKEFNIETKKDEYAQAFVELLGTKVSSSLPPLKHGCRLDQPWIPNFVTMGYRYFANRIRRRLQENQNRAVRP
jgi:glycosyltransferase involved in cell wall biosynthesis